MGDLASKIDHTILRPDLTLDLVQAHCREAAQWQCAAVCLPPWFTRDAKRILTQADSKTKVAVVVGFPMGYSAIAAKSEEIKRATDEGADEIDAVLNVTAIKNGAWNHVQNELDLLVRATHMKGITLKVIIEAGLLTDEELKHTCTLASAAGANMVKNSTGFFGNPATVDVIQRMRSYCDPKVQIKASGGIKSAEEAQAMLDAGAVRIGTSATAQILGMLANS
jgi:deoxyribose-phosphate aldolase